MLDIIFNLFQSFILIKITLIILITFFIVFLLIVFNQTIAMNKVISVEGSRSLQSGALIILTIEFSLFVAALVLL